MPNEFEFFVGPEQVKSRLDQYFPAFTEVNLSRSRIKKLIEDGLVLVNNQPAKPGYLVKLEDRIKLFLPPEPEQTLKPELIPLKIIYEDDSVIVVDKPAGLVVHPAPGHYSGTLVNALLYHTPRLAPTGAPLRPGIVHRLDKGTSGLLVVAKTDQAYHSLVKQFKERSVQKTYLAIVHGIVKQDSGIIEAGIGRHPVDRKKMSVRASRSRAAVTHFRVLQRFKGYSLVEVKIQTGRTHQIRVHLSHLGDPIVGDTTYGKKKESITISRPLLHAQKLGFYQPQTGKFMEFESPPPQDFADFFQKVA